MRRTCSPRTTVVSWRSPRRHWSRGVRGRVSVALRDECHECRRRLGARLSPARYQRATKVISRELLEDLGAAERIEFDLYVSIARGAPAQVRTVPVDLGAAPMVEVSSQSVLALARCWACSAIFRLRLSEEPGTRSSTTSGAASTSRVRRPPLDFKPVRTCDPGAPRRSARSSRQVAGALLASCVLSVLALSSARHVCASAYLRVPPFVSYLSTGGLNPWEFFTRWSNAFHYSPVMLVVFALPLNSIGFELRLGGRAQGPASLCDYHSWRRTCSSPRRRFSHIGSARALCWCSPS